MWNNDEIAKARAYLQSVEYQKQLGAYNDAKNAYDSTYNNGGLGGFLGGLVGGVAKGIGDVGNGLIDMFGSGVAAVKDIVEGGPSSNKNQDAWLKYRRGTDDVKDAKLKTAGTALNAATNIATTAVPALSGAKIGLAANALSGGISGVADELQQQGSNATVENALKRATAGAAGGLAAGAVGKKIGNANSKIGKALLNTGLAQSAVGRGAISGAVGGAVGSGVAAGLDGQDVLNATLQGGLQGGISGGISGGVTDLARRAIGKGFSTVRDAAWEKQKANQAKQLAQQNQIEELSNKYTGTSFDENDLNSNTPAQDAYKEGRGSFSDALDELLDQKYSAAQKETNYLESKRDFYENGQEKNLNYNTAQYMRDRLIQDAPAEGGENMMNLANKIDAYMNGKGTLDLNTIREAYDLTGGEPYKGAFQDFINGQDNLINEDMVNTQKQYASALKNEQKLLNQLNDSIQPNDVSAITPKQENKETIVQINDKPEKQIANKNKLQQIGDELKQNARETQWQGLYESLDANTARRALDTNAPQMLSDMDVQPENYKEYAKTSNYINEQISKIAKDSGVMVQDAELVRKLSLDNSDVLMSDTAAKKYNTYIKQIVADGKNPTEYSASYLLEKSRELGNKAANLRGNTDDVKALRGALTDAKWILRNEATQALEQSGVTGDLTTDLLANGLTNLGANQKVVDYYSAPNAEGNAPNASDYIKRSSLFEQARDMGTQMSAEQYTRNASKGKTNLLTYLAEYMGLDKPIKTIGKNVVAPISAGTQSIVGTGVSKLGDFLASTSTATPEQQNIINSFIGRAEANQNAGNVITSSEQARDYEQLKALGDMVNANAPASINNANGINYAPTMQNANTSGMMSNLDTLSRAMQLALAAGDIAAYSKLADLYTTAYKINEIQNPTASATSDLSTSEKNQLAKLELASSNLDRLEALYNQAGGGQGLIGGNVANFLGTIGLNPNVNTYNQLAQGLINDISAAVGNSQLNTEAKVQRALELVPKITDDAQTARTKLAELRSMLQESNAIYNQVYGM